MSIYASWFSLFMGVFLLSLHVNTFGEENIALDKEPLELLSQTDTTTPVEYLYKKTPVYPYLLRTTGNKGRVLTKVLVGEQGVVEKIEVVESSHPAFEQAAVRAVSKWCFVPATRQSKPIAAWVLVPIKFSLDEAGEGDDGVSPYTFPQKQKENIPAELQYDSPPKVRVVAPVVYPLDLLNNNISGSAKVSVLVNPSGNVHEVKILEASHPSFGLATKAMMESWTFNPASKNGLSTWAFFVKNQKFDRDERDTFLDAKALQLLEKTTDASSKIYKLSELDTIPKAFYQPIPVYPEQLKQNKITGKVAVEFYIDTDGMVQFPHILKSESEELAWLALTAVQRWQFEPPMLNGKAVNAIVTVPVNFN